MEKVIFWHEAVLISFLFLLIPLLICSSGMILFIQFNIKSSKRGLRHFLTMLGLLVLHLVLSFALTIFLLLLDGMISHTFFDHAPLITNGWVALSVYFVISECITIPTFYNVYKYFVNRKIQKLITDNPVNFAIKRETNELAHSAEREQRKAP